MVPGLDRRSGTSVHRVGSLFGLLRPPMTLVRMREGGWMMRLRTYRVVVCVMVMILSCSGIGLAQQQEGQELRLEFRVHARDVAEWRAWSCENLEPLLEDGWSPDCAFGATDIVSVDLSEREIRVSDESWLRVNRCLAEFGESLGEEFAESLREEGVQLLDGTLSVTSWSTSFVVRSGDRVLMGGATDTIMSPRATAHPLLVLRGSGPPASAFGLGLDSPPLPHESEEERARRLDYDHQCELLRFFDSREFRRLLEDSGVRISHGE